MLQNSIFGFISLILSAASGIRNKSLPYLARNTPSAQASAFLSMPHLSQVSLGPIFDHRLYGRNIILRLAKMPIDNWASLNLIPEITHCCAAPGPVFIGANLRSWPLHRMVLTIKRLPFDSTLLLIIILLPTIALLAQQYNYNKTASNNEITSFKVLLDKTWPLSSLFCNGYLGRIGKSGCKCCL